MSSNTQIAKAAHTFVLVRKRQSTGFAFWSHQSSMPVHPSISNGASGLVITRGPKGYFRSREFSKYIRCKLDSIADQKSWRPFRSAWKTQTCQRTLRSCFLSTVVEFRSAVSKKKWKIRGQGGHLVFPIGPKKSNYDEDVTSWFLSSFIVFRSAVSEEKSKMSQQIRGQADHLVFLILLRNTHWIEDVEILLTVKFRWILLSSFGREMDRVMAKTRILAMCRQWPWPWRYDLWPRPWHTLGSWIIIV